MGEATIAMNDHVVRALCRALEAYRDPEDRGTWTRTCTAGIVAGCTAYLARSSPSMPAASPRRAGRELCGRGAWYTISGSRPDESSGVSA